jgi:hypothetical protein
VRVCARDGCDASLEGRRGHARFCTGACRAAASRARAAERTSSDTPLEPTRGDGETAQKRTACVTGDVTLSAPVGALPDRAACRYPEHRRWLSRSGQIVCAVCHPPACASVVARWLDGERDAA